MFSARDDTSDGSAALVDRDATDPGDRHSDLAGDLDRLLAAARPRLTRLAQLRGVPPEEADDVVQDTLLIAWQRLGRLREPARFDAWLDGICRNRCRHHRRDAQAMARRDASAPGARGDSGGAAAPAGAGWPGRGDELADPLGFDPAEDLARQDWEALLDRALGYLSAQARSVVELCYLAEEPRRAAAERLGLSVGALEMRAHRARRQLRAALAGPLRGEAEAAGLLLDPEPAADWRETREWCPLCARRRLRGLFAPQPDGSVRLCLRCPDCSPRYGTDIFRSEAVAQLGTLTSFRPALQARAGGGEGLLPGRAAAGRTALPALRGAGAGAPGGSRRVQDPHAQSLLDRARLRRLRRVLLLRGDPRPLLG